MNRQIKFRAWEKYDQDFDKLRGVIGEMHYTEDYGKDESLYEKRNVVISGFYHNSGWSWEDFILMQFTGLLDKNGVEIYEGDIVYLERGGKDHDFKKPGWKSTIVWSDDYACFMQKETGNEIDRDDMSRVEIIGNIYENPELLK